MLLYNWLLLLLDRSTLWELSALSCIWLALVLLLLLMIKLCHWSLLGLLLHETSRLLESRTEVYCSAVVRRWLHRWDSLLLLLLLLILGRGSQSTHGGRFLRLKVVLLLLLLRLHKVVGLSGHPDSVPTVEVLLD